MTQPDALRRRIFAVKLQNCQPLVFRLLIYCLSINRVAHWRCNLNSSFAVTGLREKCH
jgi:hypothetical protein